MYKPRDISPKNRCQEQIKFTKFFIATNVIVCKSVGFFFLIQLSTNQHMDRTNLASEFSTEIVPAYTQLR